MVSIWSKLDALHTLFTYSSFVQLIEKYVDRIKMFPLSEGDEIDELEFTVQLS